MFLVHQYTCTSQYCYGYSLTHCSSLAEQDGTLLSLGSSKLRCCAVIFLFELERGASCRLVSLVPDLTLRVEGKGHQQTIIAACHANTYNTRWRDNPIAVATGYKLALEGMRGNTFGSDKHLRYIPRIPSKAMV